ncbi:MAG: hypothetical protein M3421_13595 [Bacteroidota bacterium]|nr:hypothetical protein [Bacteroidota bacterium]
MKKTYLIFSLSIGIILFASCDKEEDSTDIIVSCNSKNLSIDAEVTEASCGLSEGTLSAAAAGGTGNFSYKVGEGPFQTSGEFSGLKPGVYKITAKDADDCSVSGEFTIPSGIKFQNSIKPIIENNCAISGCHVAGTGRADFTSFSNIKSSAQRIKELTASKAMPKTGSLTDEEIEQIACWVDDGAPNN